MPTTKQKRTPDAIASLKADHKKVKELFEKFEKAKDRRRKQAIVMEALEELGIHATLEEDLFYPAIRAAIRDKEGIMEEADEEHHVAKVLIAELEGMDGSESHYDAKFTVLAENVRHHIKEEEGEMLPKAKKTRIDFAALGQEMLERKEALLREGVPVTAEAEMVAKSQGQGDSPAKASREGSH
jgi:Hemerythrin HHE cation binding domain